MTYPFMFWLPHLLKLLIMLAYLIGMLQGLACTEL